MVAASAAARLSEIEDVAEAVRMLYAKRGEIYDNVQSVRVRRWSFRLRPSPRTYRVQAMRLRQR